MDDINVKIKGSETLEEIFNNQEWVGLDEIIQKLINTYEELKRVYENDEDTYTIDDVFDN